MEVIHKLNITPEAAFDISEALGLERFDKQTLKAEVEEYITRMTAAGRLPWWGYFRADYFCEDSGERLKLFIYKGAQAGLMQVWDLRGVCLAEDWTQEDEDDGRIRAWLNSSISELDKGDWVLTLRAEQRRRERLYAEAEHENYGEDYTAMVKELLKNYKLNKAKVAVMPKDAPETAELSDKLDFLDLCVNQLSDEEQAVVRELYYNAQSLKRVGRKYGYSKPSVFRLKEKAVAVIELLFAERYGS